MTTSSTKETAMAESTPTESPTAEQKLPRGSVTYKHKRTNRKVTYSKAHPVLEKSSAWERLDEKAKA